MAAVVDGYDYNPLIYRHFGRNQDVNLEVRLPVQSDRKRKAGALTPLRRKRLAFVLRGWLERCQQGGTLDRYSYWDPVIAPGVPEARLGLFVMQWGDQLVEALEGHAE